MARARVRWSALALALRLAACATQDGRGAERPTATDTGGVAPSREAPSAAASSGDGASSPAAAPPAAAATTASLPPPADPSPLEPDLSAALHGVRADPPPRALTRERHYYVSNEQHHHLYRPTIEGLGGIQLGVGAEQNYLLAGWARPEVLVLVDFDQAIVDLHEVYGVLFTSTSSAGELVDAWAFGARRSVARRLEERWPDPALRKRRLRVYDEARAEVHARLQRLRARDARVGVPSFLTDPEQFRRLAALWATGRVLAVRGDLTQDRALTDLAAFARRSRLPVRVLYLSNAEEYFDYVTGHFTSNLRALPFDERSVVLHTRGHHGDHYRFVHQRAKDYLAWIAAGVPSWEELAKRAVPASDAPGAEELRIIPPPP
ncbi:MAG: hypothetical protein IT376_12040 [Polyangiaceae bacterium]|nr:hypothetical protein [Polyangiaceae bacterium]